MSEMPPPAEAAAAVPNAPPPSLEAFLERWRPRLQYRGFAQVWTDPKSGRTVDFAQIADLEELARESAAAEAEYLAGIDALRRRFTAQAPHPAYAVRLPDGSERRFTPEEWFERELAKADLYWLTKFVLGYDKLVFHLHFFMARTMADLPEGYRGLRQFARDSFKTTVMGIAWAIQEVLRDPEARILYKSNAEANAKNKVAEARNHFLHNRTLRALFPEHVPQRRSDEGSEGSFTTPAKRSPQKEGTLTAAGVGTSKTSQHYTHIVGDDFWDAKSVTSVERTAATARELSELEYLLESPARGRILFISTRFAHDDPTARFLADPAYECVIVSGILPCGRSTFPENLPLPKMIGQAMDAYTFSCQVLLSPTSDDQRLPRAAAVRWRELREMEARGLLRLRTILATDAAGSRSRTSDEAAIMAVALDSTGRATVVGSLAAKMAPSEFVTALFAEFDRWAAEFAVVQKAAIDTVILSFIEERNEARLKEGRRAMPIIRYSLGNEEKKRRITAALQPLLARGSLALDPDMPDVTGLEREIAEHPNTGEDHRLDALAALGDPAIRAVPAPPLRTHAPPDAAAALAALAGRSLRDLVAEARRASVREAAAVAERDAAGTLRDGEVAA